MTSYGSFSYEHKEENITDKVNSFLNDNRYNHDKIYIRKYTPQSNLILSSDMIIGNNPDTTYTPEEMVNEINDLNIIPEEAFIWTGNCPYRGSSVYGYGWFMDRFKDKIVTKNIQNATHMFDGYQGDNIPFDLNFTTSNTSVITQLFYNCNNLTTLPKINNLRIGMTSQNYIFYNCQKLREIPEEWAEDFNWDAIHNNNSGMSINYWFYNCYSLRKIPQNLIANIWSKVYSTSSQYYPYNGQYSSCYCLETLENLPVIFYASGSSSNLFSSAFTSCSRLKKLTFQPSENVKWKSQTIDLTSYIGYNNDVSYITGYNSGLTTATQITDDTTYQTLKDNPDSWTTRIEYSRYNHDSAVETINSLPDTSAYGTNTIKFKGQSGSLTDGGAINTMTDAEIAVAASKGWTVTFS